MIAYKTSAQSQSCEQSFTLGDSVAAVGSSNSTSDTSEKLTAQQLSEIENKRIAAILQNPEAKDYTVAALAKLGFNQEEAENFWNKFLAGTLIIKTLGLPTIPYNFYNKHVFPHVVGRHGNTPLNLDIEQGLSPVVELITRAIETKGDIPDDQFLTPETSNLKLQIGGTDYVKTLLYYGNRIYSDFNMYFYKSVKLEKVEVKENELYIRITWTGDKDRSQDLYINRTGEGAKIRITSWDKGKILSTIFKKVGNFQTDRITFNNEPLKTSDTKDDLLENIILGLFIGPIVFAL